METKVKVSLLDYAPTSLNLQYYAPEICRQLDTALPTRPPSTRPNPPPGTQGEEGRPRPPHPCPRTPPGIQEGGGRPRPPPHPPPPYTKHPVRVTRTRRGFPSSTES